MPKSSDIFLTSYGRVVLYFSNNQDGFDHTISDIHKITKISYRQLQRILPDLETMKIIKRTRVVGRNIMYEIENKTLADAINSLNQCFSRSSKGIKLVDA